MKSHSRFASLFLFTLALTTNPSLHTASDIKSELFTSTRLVYEDNFDSGKLNTNFWEIRQSSTWVIKDGALHGSQSTKEFQEKMIAKGDRAHAGFKPVIFLKQVPESFVCAMRVRYDAKAYQKGFPLLDVGHHIHTLSFGEKATTLAIKKNVQTLTTPKPLFALNQWHEVVIELKKGTHPPHDRRPEASLRQLAHRHERTRADRLQGHRSWHLPD